jgi:hypothetical protein
VSPEATVAEQPRLKIKYREQVAPDMQTEFGYTNPMQTATRSTPHLAI